MILKGIKTFLLMGVALLVVSPIKAMAAPHFTLTPSAENEKIGQNFSVVMGVDSDTFKVVGVDIKATFDASKLEIVTVEKGNIPEGEAYYQFGFTPSQPIINNTNGTFEVTLSPNSQSIYDGPVAKQELLKITFRPKAAGVATVNYVCTADSVMETNIISTTGNDVVDCGSNQSGSYTITGSGGDNTPAATSTPVPEIIRATTTTNELPRTGGVMETWLLVLAGLGSVISAVYILRI